MDYEKMYKEALERAKKFEEKYGGGYAEYIFPELAESEDERIRKELKEAFEAYDIESKWNGIPVRSIIAWLEKQKKPENTSASTMAPSCWAEEPSLQKEQKPAEWSEEDEENLNSIISCLNRSLDGVIDTVEITNVVGEIAWLKSLRPQYHGDVTMTKAYKMGLEAGKASSWKPSEEQMDKLKEVIYGLCTCGNGPVLKSLYEQLKKL